MRKLAIIIIIAAFGSAYLYFDRKEVHIIDAHHVGNAVALIVDRLPLTDSSKIKWWESNQDKIRGKYHIPAGLEGPFLIDVFAFGEGYQEDDDDEDRLCFEDVKPPRNCIDKKILMSIWTTREGGVKYVF